MKSRMRKYSTALAILAASVGGYQAERVASTALSDKAVVQTVSDRLSAQLGQNAINTKAPSEFAWSKDYERLESRQLLQTEFFKAASEVLAVAIDDRARAVLNSERTNVVFSASRAETRSAFMAFVKGMQDRGFNIDPGSRSLRLDDLARPKVFTYPNCPPQVQYDEPVRQVGMSLEVLQGAPPSSVSGKGQRAYRIALATARI